MVLNLLKLVRTNASTESACKFQNSKTIDIDSHNNFKIDGCALAPRKMVAKTHILFALFTLDRRLIGIQSDC